MPNVSSPPGPVVSVSLPEQTDVAIIEGQPIVIIPTSPAPIVSVTQPQLSVDVTMGAGEVNVETVSNPLILPISATDALPIPGPPGPAGPAGTTPTVNVGTTSTLAPGVSATVTNTGTSSAALFNFGIPQGVAGPQGPQGITGAPGATGPPGPTAVSTDANNYSHLGSDSLLYTPTPVIPGPSSTTPAMDGTGAVGTGTTWARDDHVHPSDTSRLIKAGDTMTGALVLAADPVSASQASTKNYVDTSIAALNEIYMRWVPYTGTAQSFLHQDLTRDGDWTMVANKDTSTRPAPQPSGPEEDLLPAWTPAAANARASYTVYNEWTINTGGWLDQYGVDVLTQNLNASHAVTLSINGTVKDTFSATPTVSELYWHDITPILVASGAVIRVTLQVTQVGNNAMYWYQQTGLFATAPTYCSLAVGSKDGAAAGTTAYGCHAQLIPGTASPDWDVVAYGGAAAGGAGGLVTVWGEIPTGTIDGTNQNFTSAYTYKPNLLAVFLNGLRLLRTTDYVETGNQSFQLVNAPLPGDSVSIDYIQP